MSKTTFPAGTLHSNNYINPNGGNSKGIHPIPESGETFVHNERRDIVNKFNVGDKGILYLYNGKDKIARGLNTQVSFDSINFITESVQKLSKKEQLSNAVLYNTPEYAPRGYSITYRVID